MTRTHLDAVDTFAPETSAVRHTSESYAWSAWMDVLAHRAECPHCRPRFARADGSRVL